MIKNTRKPNLNIIIKIYSSKVDVIHLIKVNPIYFGSTSRISEYSVKMTDLIKHVQRKTLVKKETLDDIELVVFLSNSTVILYCIN